MPLTPFQAEVIAVISGNRSETSHFAGGLVLNSSPASARYSHDFDIFHEAAEEVSHACETDAASIRAAGFTFELVVGDWDKHSTFRKAKVSRGADSVDIDWAADSAFRFFPIERDPLLGWRLHLFDMATNKALALAARSVSRDYVDIIELGKIFPLQAIVWAAVGKDPGYAPLFLLALMRRFARVRREDLVELQARNLDPIALKMEWTDMAEAAGNAMKHLADTQPDTPIGVAFVDAAGKPGWLGDDPTLKVHEPCIRGCLPTISGLSL